MRTKRVYEPADPADGRRVLVDRIWPRGVSRERADVDAWMPEVAPSTDLRKWFGHDPARWDEFQTRYRAELADNPDVDQLAALMGDGPLTLVYSARDTEHNQALVIASVLDGR